MLESTTALRYVTPMREGGSLPGIVEAEDLGTYVVKFRGAGQGPKVLVAEVIVGELARRLGIRVPELKTIEVDEAIGLREPDREPYGDGAPVVVRGRESRLQGEGGQ